jgi:hypothetical protein
MPPPALAMFFEKVELLTVSVPPALLKMPPPILALFSEKVELVIVSVGREAVMD